MGSRAYRGYLNRRSRAFGIYRQECSQDIKAYEMMWGDLVAFVDHYYYPMNSKEMKYMLKKD